MSDKFLIVTNTYNRELALVQRSVEASLRELAQEPHGHLLLIDQNTKPLNLPESTNFTHFIKQVNSVSEARNILFELKWINQYDWLIFCDDDGYMAEGYIQKLKNILSSHPDLQAIAGSIVRDDNGDFYSPRHQIGGSLKNFRHSKLLMGSNFAVKTKVFFDLNGFDERFGAGAFYGSGEETDFCWKLFFNKVPMEFFQELQILHIKPYAGSLEHSLKKAYMYGYGKGALTGKWLFEKRKLVVLYEVIEMFLVPTARILLSLLKFDFKNVRIHHQTLIGRIFGLIQF